MFGHAHVGRSCNILTAERLSRTILQAIVERDLLLWKLFARQKPINRRRFQWTGESMIQEYAPGLKAKPPLCARMATTYLTFEKVLCISTSLVSVNAAFFFKLQARGKLLSGRQSTDTLARFPRLDLEDDMDGAHRRESDKSCSQWHQHQHASSGWHTCICETLVKEQGRVKTKVIRKRGVATESSQLCSVPRSLVPMERQIPPARLGGRHLT
ncbi:hypothetical protein B0O99DRAFT_66067 [Bisporella sp. PMI_857]|nr:hypothetical protein B0O99DRAFT_66067 [Bisporella sp. PMI_857]